MRSDMHKVIVERPRMLRSAWRSRKTALHLDTVRSSQAHDAGEDYDSGPGRAACSRYQKHLNENLAPLKRYLRAQVGRPWDKVYSEIRTGIPCSAVGLHVLQHVGDFVAIDTYLEDGVVRERSYGWFRPVRGLYVHPVTKLLRVAKTKEARTSWRSPQAYEQEPDFLPIARREAYEKIAGLWYFTQFRGSQPSEPGPFVLLSKKQCDRKTVRKIESGELGPVINKQYWIRTFGWIKR